MAAAPDPERIAVFRSFLVSHAMIDRALVVALEEERDLPLPWFEALNALQAAGGTLRVMDLAERLVVSPSSLSRQLNRLEEAGYVRRERGQDSDQRAVAIVLTRDGRDVWRKANTTYQRVVKKHFTSQLTESDLGAMQRLLTKLIES